jgi:tetratricopeptide (TPR) repeat protein
MSDNAAESAKDVTEVTERPKPKRKRSGLDPLTKRLVLASGVLVLLIIALTAAVVYVGAQSRTVPRTQVERNLMVARQQTQTTPKDPNAWISLASAATQAEKYDEAGNAISALQQLTSQAVVPLLRGDLAVAKGDLSGARGYYAKAVEQGKKDVNTEKDKAAEAGVSPSQVKPSEAMVMAYLALGRLDMEAKDYGSAIKNLKAAVASDPTAADSLAALGDAEAAAGQTKAAEGSYKNALKFIPDYQPALDGLKRLQGGR